MFKNTCLFILLLSFCFASPVWSQDYSAPVETTDGYVIDSVEIDSLSYSEDEYTVLDEQAQPVYRKDSVDGKALDSTTWKNLTKDLNYGDTLDHKSKPDEKRAKKDDVESSNFQFFNINSTITTYILFAIVIAALLFLIYRLMGSAFFAPNAKIKKTEATFEMLHDDEQMMQKDLNSLLAEALQRQDYKTAIRILFIQSLQDLQVYEWIQWKKEKTNRDYLNEIMHREAFVPFGSMVLLYEKAWYSESVATKEDFDAFNTFKQQIKSN